MGVVGMAIPHLFLSHYTPDYPAKTIAYFFIQNCLGVSMATTLGYCCVW